MNITSPETSPVAHLMEVMPMAIAESATYCALPHWFDRPLGSAIIESFVSNNGKSQQIMSQLLNLPFVYSHGDGTWQYTVAARQYFCNQLLQRNDDFEKLSGFLVSRLQHQWDKLVGDGKGLRLTPFKIVGGLDWQLRRVQWQLAYHWAPLDAAEAMRRLISMSEWAGSDRRRLPDHKLAVNVLHDQQSFLGDYAVEGYYLEGRYAYARRDWYEAEEKLSYVWEQGTRNPLITAYAGHLLAVIRRRKGEKAWVEDAEAMLRRSLTICEEKIGLENTDAKELASRVLNSLGATLVQQGDAARMEEAEQLLCRSLAMHEELGDMSGTSHVLNSLGMLLVQVGDTERLIEAEKLFRQALEISHSLGEDRNIAIQESSLAHLLIQQGDEERFPEAHALLYSSLRSAGQRRDDYNKALVLNRLGELLVKWGGEPRLREAEECFKHSLKLWKKKRNAQGQYEALTNLAQILEQTGRHEEAVRLREKASKIKL